MKEELISDYIELCCSIIEKKYPEYFYYDKVDLTSVIQRILYFRSTQNLNCLYPLDMVASGILIDENQSLAKERIADRISLDKGQIPNRFATTCKSISTLLRYSLKAILSSFKSKHNDIAIPYALCASYPRFIDYFKELIRELGKDNCCVLPVSEQVKEKAAAHNITSLPQSYTMFSFKRMKMPLVSPLFQVYVQSLILYLQYSACLRNNKLKTLIFAEGTSEIDAAALLASKEQSVPTVRVQSGRAGILHIGYRHMLYDKTLIWGEGFLDRFRSASPETEYIITGNYHVDGSSNMEMPDELNQFKSNVKILAVFTQPLSHYISARDYQKLYEICEYLLATYSDLKVLIRKHPSDKSSILDPLLTEYQKQTKITLASDFSLASILSISDLALGFYSTALSEAAAANVLPIMLENSTLGDVFPCPCRENAAICVPGVKEAISHIERYMHYEEKRDDFKDHMAVFARKYFGPGDGKALSRITAEIQTHS